MFGQGLASFVPPLITGAAGAVAGSRVAGRPGAAVGGAIGAAFSSAPLNYGEVYKALKDEGLSPKDAALPAAMAFFVTTDSEFNTNEKSFGRSLLWFRRKWRLAILRL